MGGEIVADFKFQTELNYLDLLKFYCILSDLGSLWLLGRGREVGVSGGMGVPLHVHTHAYVHVKHSKHNINEGSHLQFLYMYILG